MFRDEGQEDTGILAGGFLLAIPYLYTQVPLMLVDVASMFFLVLGFFSLQRALDRGGWGYIAFASASIFLMLVSKYSQWMLASVYVMLFLLKLKEADNPSERPDGSGRQKVFSRGMAVAAFAGLMFGAFLLSYLDVVRSQLDLLVSYQKPGLRRWTESFISTFFYQVHPFVSMGALASVFIAFRRRDWRWVVVAWLVILMFLMRIERSRYMVPLLPMLAICAAYGVNAAFRGNGAQRIRRLVVAAAALSSFALASSAFMPYLKTNNLVNLMEAGKFLDQQKASLVQVHAFPQKSEINPAVAVPLLDLYTDAPIEYFYNLYPLLDKDKLEVSPFRFTWTYRNPGYYDYRAERKPSHLAVVSFWRNEDNERRLPARYVFKRRFDMSEGIFRFKPYVSIYLREERP